MNMGFNDLYRFSVHAVITNNEGKVLQLKSTYADNSWGLPGGGVEPGETVHEAIKRECREELGVNILISNLTGLYYHKHYNSQVGIFRCELSMDAEICLSSEHSEFRWFDISQLSYAQQTRVKDSLEYNGQVISRAF
jgi:8-oxo-dGTP pyrophosphatase MutT (NUDIX family)